MKKIAIIVGFFFLVYISFSQTNEPFQMKKPETKKLKMDRIFISDASIPIHNINSISSFAISGNIKLTDYSSLVRVILITDKSEYLIFEGYSLISDKQEYSFNKHCDESSFIRDEVPLQIMLIVRNAEFEFETIHLSEEKLNDFDKSNFNKDKLDIKELSEKTKVLKINTNNSKKNKTWLAGITELSLLTFDEKKNFFGGNYDFLTGGYEYYIDGIFSFETFDPTVSPNLKSALTTTYPSGFDWRNRHGQNWMTSIKLQGNVCGACCAFASIAVTEIMTNLYFNSHINVDLSEQELVSCSDMDCAGCFDPSEVLAYIRDNSVCSETCFPYSASDEPCSNKCTSPTESIGFDSIVTVVETESNIKNALIFNGPILSTICHPGWCHAMALIGYNVIQIGDTIRHVTSSGSGTDVIIQTGDPLIGMTYWIFKNSYSSGHSGYHYIFLDIFSDLSVYGAINTPVTSLIYSENNRNCTDNDNDGYYWWGIGSKPTNCPYCSPNTPDCDDSNPNLGPMDSFGNCSTITAPYTFPTHQITTTEIWQSNTIECGDVIVKTGGGNLTLNGATINLENTASFAVEVGGILTFNSGVIQ